MLFDINYSLENGLYIIALTPQCSYLFFCFIYIFFFNILTTKHPIKMLLFLILIYLFGAILLWTLSFEFLAITLIIIYVGAIAILISFVIMLFNIRLFNTSNIYHQKLDKIIYCLVTIKMFTILSSVTKFIFLPHISNMVIKIYQLQNTMLFKEKLDVDFFSWIYGIQYVYIFFLLCCILFVSLIGAILLLLNSYKS